MRRRGLTLIEVIAATVLLASLTVAVVSVLQDANQIIAARAEMPELVPLAKLADALVEAPGEFGVELDGLKIEDVVAIDSVELGTVRLHVVSRDSTHAWIAIEAGQAVVCRYVEIDPEPQE